MDWLLQAVMILGMFLLRLGVPLAITFAVGYWLRRLDAKWQAEAQACWEASRAQKKAEIEPDLEMFRMLEQPCWVLKECSESVRDRCPAFQQPDIPCWMARRQAEGRLPTQCYHCELFSPKQVAQDRAN